MPFPQHVAPDELIESQWGNDVVDTLSSHDGTLAGHTSVLNSHNATLLDHTTKIDNLNAVRSLYIIGAPVGPVPGVDMAGYNMITYGIARSGVLLLNATFGVHTLGTGTHVDLDIAWFLDSSVGRVNRNTMLPNKVQTFVLSEAIRCVAGQTLYCQVKRVAGDAQYEILDTSGVFNGASILEGVVSQWV